MPPARLDLTHGEAPHPLAALKDEVARLAPDQPVWVRDPHGKSPHLLALLKTLAPSQAPRLVLPSRSLAHPAAARFLTQAGATRFLLDPDDPATPDATSVLRGLHVQTHPRPLPPLRAQPGRPLRVLLCGQADPLIPFTRADLARTLLDLGAQPCETIEDGAPDLTLALGAAPAPPEAPLLRLLAQPEGVDPWEDRPGPYRHVLPAFYTPSPEHRLLAWRRPLPCVLPRRADDAERGRWIGVVGAHVDALARALQGRAHPCRRLDGPEPSLEGLRMVVCADSSPEPVPRLLLQRARANGLPVLTPASITPPPTEASPLDAVVRAALHLDAHTGHLRARARDARRRAPSLGLHAWVADLLHGPLSP